MPDCFYHPFFRPLLFRFSPGLARDLTLSSIGLLARLPMGKDFIECLGQMSIPPDIERCVCDLSFRGPVGLAAGLDTHLAGAPALSRFGLSFLEVGPVTLEPVHTTMPIKRLTAERAISYPDLPVNDGLASIAAKLGRLIPQASLIEKPSSDQMQDTDRRSYRSTIQADCLSQELPKIPGGIVLGICLAYKPGSSAAAAAGERCYLLEQLAPYANFFTLDSCSEVMLGAWSQAEWKAHLATIMQALRSLPQFIPLFLCLPADIPLQLVDELLAPAVELGISGVVAGCGVREEPGRRLLGAPIQERSICLVRAVRARWGKHLTIIGEGGIDEPADALQMLRAGAALVQVHSGLVYAGPGLPKRINEALACLSPQPLSSSHTPARSTSLLGLLKQGWLWLAFLGIGMLVGGFIAGMISVTSVILPYDELFLGLDQAQIALINTHILPFMTHDRMTLAGTMVSLGILYTTLAVQGVRKGLRWAWLAIVVSCIIGFVTFFLFLGFGYFDPLHALLSAILFVFFCLGVRKLPSRIAWESTPDLHNDWRWRLALRGQFLIIAACIVLIVAGLTIATVGTTNVFVPEDIPFLHTTPAALHAANPRLIPLIAHDRAGFGGALLANGLALLLVALWGFSRGARWVWWMLYSAGAVEFLATVSIHLLIGYINLWHLAPAFLVALPYVAGLLLAYPYLHQRETPLRRIRRQVRLLATAAEPVES